MPAPNKTAPKMDAQRVKLHLQSRFNPIRGLTPERLSSFLDAFDLGYLRDAALLWQKMRERDDTIITVAEKRDLDAAMLNWEVLPIDDSPEALLHKTALEDFYNNLVATDALDLNQRGGVSKLVRQMMGAVGYRYAVHEIVWQPGIGTLGAEFRHTPLQFFENRTGRLRFLRQDYAQDGEDLEAGGWMVSTGPGLMIASSIAYIFKQLPLKDWLVFCEKAGIPGLHGETTAAKGSEEWDDFKEALANFGVDWALVTSANAKVNTIDLKASGQLPHPPLVDRMDRAISRIWRGGDLGTMSQAGDASGSNPQEREGGNIAEADALMISETLQHYVDRWVIWYRFGTTTPRAYFKLQPSVDVDVDREIKIDTALIGWGVPRSKKDLLEKYGRAEPDAGDELATSGPALGASPFGFANAALDESDAIFTAEALREYAPAVQAVVRPLLTRLDQIRQMDDPATQRAALQRFAAAWPELAKEAMTRAPAAAAVMEKIVGSALVSGFAEAAKPTA